MDVGLFLLVISVMLNHFFSEKEMGAATLIIGASFGLGGLGAFAVNYLFVRIFGKLGQ
jgi:hypothetical protein